MPLLSTTDLQAFSDLFTNFIADDTCNILRNLGIKDGNGSVLSDPTNWPAVNDNPIPCSVVDNGGAVQEILENTQFGKAQKMILLPRGQDVKANDRIQTLSNNVYYQVIVAMDPQSFEVVRRAVVQRHGTGANL